MPKLSPTRLPEPTTNVSSHFSDPTADAVFVSSDNVIFRIHRAYLNTTTTGFAVPPLTSSDNSQVRLTEPSEVLEILFQFIQPCSAGSDQYRQPSVMTMTPENLFAVAEAAEKYIVFGAMNIFLTRMNHPDIYLVHPIEVLNHCAKHGYADLASLAARQSLSFPFDRIVKGLTHPGLLGKWMLYYGQWLQYAQSVQQQLTTDDLHKCPRAAYIKLHYLTEIISNISFPGGVGSLLNITFPPDIRCRGASCNCVCRNFRSDFRVYDTPILFKL